MSLAADIYFELTQAKLAPDVPFCAAPDQWRESMIRAVGGADDWKSQCVALDSDNFRLSVRLDDANERAGEWKRKYEAAVAATKESVTA